jgi:hypothetical protein
MEEQNSPFLEPLLTPKQLGDYLGFQARTIRLWIRKGVKIDPQKVVKIGTSIRIYRSEAERLAGETKIKLGKPTT